VVLCPIRGLMAESESVGVFLRMAIPEVWEEKMQVLGGWSQCRLLFAWVVVDCLISVLGLGVFEFEVGIVETRRLMSRGWCWELAFVP
jgi:hypothetical protein